MSSASPSADRTRTESGEPPEPSVMYYITLTLTSTALWTLLVGPLLTLLPEQSSRIAGGDKVSTFAWVAGVGGLCGILTNPVAGWLSDRTTWRFGRRRPWILVGAALTVAFTPLVAGATTTAELMVGWVAVQVAVTPVMAALMATVPDLVPTHRRGRASACLGISWALAPVLGTAVAAMAGTRIGLAYAIMAVMLAASGVLFAAVNPDPPGTTTTPWREAASAFWVSPRRYPDFGWAWLTRFCMALAQNMAVAFLPFFLVDVVRYEQDHPGQTATDGLVVISLIYATSVIVAALLFGARSDRTGKRKVFVITSTILFSAGTLLGAVFPTWEGLLVLAVLTGLGFGAYEAVDMALVTQVLPTADARAKDLSLINVATTSGVMLGPVLAAPIVTSFGYGALFIAAALVAMLAAAFVAPIRGVR